MTIDFYAAKSNASIYRVALICLRSLFFMWIFYTCLNDILIPYLKDPIEFSFTSVLMITFFINGALFLASLLIEKMRVQKGIVAGLLIGCVGCLLFYPAVSMEHNALFLLTPFISCHFILPHFLCRFLSGGRVFRS